MNMAAPDGQLDPQPAPERAQPMGGAGDCAVGEDGTSRAIRGTVTVIQGSAQRNPAAAVNYGHCPLNDLG